jgi:hypothetical protein
MARSKKRHMEFLFHFCFRSVKLKSASVALRRAADAGEEKERADR